MMNKKQFYPYIIVLAVFIQVAYTQFRAHFAAGENSPEVVALLTEQLEREKTRSAVAQYEIRSVRQHVATLFPNEVMDTRYPVRNLASVTREHGETYLEK